MRKSQVKIGGVYIAKVSNKLVRVRLDRESIYGGWDATNLLTGRSIHIRTAGRLRREVRPNEPTSVGSYIIFDLLNKTSATNDSPTSA